MARYRLGGGALGPRCRDSRQHLRLARESGCYSRQSGQEPQRALGPALKEAKPEAGREPEDWAMVARCTGFLSCCLSSLLLRCAQDGAQSLPDNYFLSGFDRHGNQFDMIWLLAFLAVGIAFAHRSHQAGIVRAQHFDDGIAGTKFSRHSRRWKSPRLAGPISLLKLDSDFRRRGHNVLVVTPGTVSTSLRMRSMRAFHSS